MMIADATGGMTTIIVTVINAKSVKAFWVSCSISRA